MGDGGLRRRREEGSGAGNFQQPPPPPWSSTRKEEESESEERDSPKSIPIVLPKLVEPSVQNAPLEAGDWIAQLTFSSRVGGNTSTSRTSRHVRRLQEVSARRAERKKERGREKTQTLAELTSTKPASPSEERLRLWRRQMLRAVELQAALPDPVLQMKALDVVMKELLKKDARRCSESLPIVFNIRWM